MGEPGFVGLIRIAEFSAEGHASPENLTAMGAELDARVLEFNEERYETLLAAWPGHQASG